MARFTALYFGILKAYKALEPMSSGPLSELVVNFHDF
jgi:hypothetical protein